MIKVNKVAVPLGWLISNNPEKAKPALSSFISLEEYLGLLTPNSPEELPEALILNNNDQFR